MNKNILKVIFGGLSLYMLCLVLATSLKNNFFEALPQLNQQPWFVTTIYDFYFNIAILAVWVIYRECSRLTAVLWIIGFICLGSIATCFYVFLQLYRLKPDEAASNILLRKF